MSYIIVWRNTHREPFIDLDDNNFKESYSTFEDAKESAEYIVRTEGKGSHFHDYAIYEEVNS